MQINDLVRNAGGEFARPTLFNAFLNFPSTVDSSISQLNYDILCKNIALPNFNHELINLKYLGQDVPVVSRVNTGNRISLTFLVEETQTIIDELSIWLRGMDKYHYSNNSDVNALQETLTSEKMGTLTVTPKTWSDESTLSYIFTNLFPVSLGGINFQSDNTSSIIEINVEFAFLTYDIIGKNGSLSTIINQLESENMFTGELLNGIESHMTDMFATLNQATQRVENAESLRLSGYSNFTQNIPFYAPSTISKLMDSVKGLTGIGDIFKF